MPKASGLSKASWAGLLVIFLWSASPAATPTVDLSTLVDAVGREKWPDGQAPAGSGFIVSSSGKVFTSAHVIAGCRHIYVSYRRTPEQIIPGMLLGQDSRLDAALLSVPSLRVHDAFLRFTDEIPDDGSSLTIGSALHDIAPSTAVAMGMATETGSGRIFHFRATLSPGSSGSPILNRQGDVVAFVVGKLESTKGVGIGVSSRDLRDFLSYFNIPMPQTYRGGVEGVLRSWTETNDAPAPNLSDIMLRVICK